MQYPSLLSLLAEPVLNYSLQVADNFLMLEVENKNEILVCPISGRKQERNICVPTMYIVYYCVLSDYVCVADIGRLELLLRSNTGNNPVRWFVHCIIIQYIPLMYTVVLLFTFYAPADHCPSVIHLIHIWPHPRKVVSDIV